jgi:hypothetical protein
MQAKMNKNFTTILYWRCNLKGTQPRQNHAGLYLVPARLVLTKYGGGTSANGKNEDAPAKARASCLFFASTLAKEAQQ